MYLFIFWQALYLLVTIIKKIYKRIESSRPEKLNSMSIFPMNKTKCE